MEMHAVAPSVPKLSFFI